MRSNLELLAGVSAVCTHWKAWKPATPVANVRKTFRIDLSNFSIPDDSIRSRARNDTAANSCSLSAALSTALLLHSATQVSITSFCALWHSLVCQWAEWGAATRHVATRMALRTPTRNRAANNAVAGQGNMLEVKLETDCLHLYHWERL